MKVIHLLIAVVLLSCSKSSYGQISGKKTKESITIFDSIEVKPGDRIFLGRGTGLRGDFEYIYVPRNVWTGIPETSLNRSFTNRNSTIKHFKNQKTKKSGDKIVAVVNFGAYNCIADLEAAIESGEIIAINDRNFKEKTVNVISANNPTTQVNVQQQPTSKADELKKLKELLDSGVLTQAEYDTEKKKILDRP